MADALHTGASAVRTASIFNALVGLWLAASPFVLRFDGATPTSWNTFIVGVVVFLLAGFRIHKAAGTGWMGVVSAALGVWMIVAPFVLGDADNGARLWNSLISGALVTGLSFWSWFAERPESMGPFHERPA